MYKRHTGQVSMLESPEMFGSLPLDPNNDWIKLSKLVPWREFDLKYADNFSSKKGQRAIDSRMALGALLIKPAYKAMSDEDITKEIAMNPYLQYFLGLQEYRYECPFDSSMMTRFRQRITPEMLDWVNDQIIDRKAEQDRNDDDNGGTGGQADENKGGESEAEKNQGTSLLSLIQSLFGSSGNEPNISGDSSMETCPVCRLYILSPPAGARFFTRIP